MLEEISKAVEEKLTRESKKRVGKENGIKVVENAWITEEIRKEIKLRREYNRKKRKETSASVKEELDKLYNNISC